LFYLSFPSTYHGTAPGRRISWANRGRKPTLREFIIPADAKKNLRKELASLNINTFSIYGDLENLAKWLIEAYRDM
jgi:hypothetical protein